MATKLERIAQLSKENPNMVFTSIGHLINIEMLDIGAADSYKKITKSLREAGCFGR